MSPKISCIRECGSTLYVGSPHTTPPTNTKFNPLLLPTQMAILYTNTCKHRTSYFKSTHFWVHLSDVSQFLPTNKNKKFLRFIPIFTPDIFSLIQNKTSPCFIKKIISIGRYFLKVRAFGTLITSTIIYIIFDTASTIFTWRVLMQLVVVVPNYRLIDFKQVCTVTIPAMAVEMASLLEYCRQL